MQCISRPEQQIVPTASCARILKQGSGLVRALRSIVLAIFVLLGSHVVVYAQAPAALPPGMTQEQFDALVDAISKSVAEKLKAESVPSAPSTVPPAAPAAKSGKGGSAAAAKPKVVKVAPASGDEFAVVLEESARLARAVPTLGRQLAAIPGFFDESERGGRGPAGFLLLLGIVAVAAVAAEAILRKALRPLRHRLAGGAVPEQGMRSLIHLGSLALLEGLGLFVVWLICHGAVGAWFTGGAEQDKFAVAALTGIFGWRLYVVAFRVVLRPGLPTARLCDVDDHAARAMYARISAVMLLLILGRVLYSALVAIETPPEALRAYSAIAALVYFGAFAWLVLRSKDAARQWFGGLGKVVPLAGMVGRNWGAVAMTFFAALAVTQLYGAISEQAHVPLAMRLTLNLVVGVLLFETLLQAFVRRLDSQLVGLTPASDAPKLPDVVARCVRVAVLIGVAVIISESWVVEVFRLVNEDEWAQLTRSSRTAGITLFLAFVLWEFFKYVTEPYMGRKPAGGTAAASGDGAGTGASRLGTLMPLLRITVAIVIILIAVLIALEDFGVNITPLIAGASVFGLAISFGSQTLVRDIVSGIFYLSDDAFRVGEYIDCGKAKGTVEGFTIRSLKLRHQNGQIHTIPFGQLGQITNFSRDWTTVKFNLRFARNTDLEKLRKAAKKIGADMMEMPEFKEEIIEPFKMQGVADIADNAFLVRFKFTAKPGNPTLIQREAMKRMFAVFPDLGIEFAKEGAAVVLQTIAGPADLTPAAGPAEGVQARSEGEKSTVVPAQ
jgi:moderate conductance mechanosensitive channel